MSARRSLTPTGWAAPQSRADERPKFVGVEEVVERDVTDDQFEVVCNVAEAVAPLVAIKECDAVRAAEGHRLRLEFAGMALSCANGDHASVNLETERCVRCGMRVTTLAVEHVDGLRCFGARGK